MNNYMNGKKCSQLYSEYILLNSNVGPTGPTGPTGPVGEAPNFLIGNVLTGPPGTSAEVTIRRLIRRDKNG